jgi:DNA-binding response OmpR family regulator
MMHREAARHDHPASRVLVIEDDAQLRRIIVLNLARRGHAVREAADVRQALEALADERPDLLLLDINLPDGTGWDVLRASDLPADVPTVVLTAASVEPRRLAEFRGLTYLPKPFPMEALVRLVERHDGAAR